MSKQSIKYELYDYQREAYNAFWNGVTHGITKPVITMATGTGKTILFGNIATEAIEKGITNQVLIITHTDELIQQAVDKVWRTNPDYENKIGIIKANTNECDQPIVVASRQSLHGKRLKTYPKDKFQFIITDEAHHATAPSYLKIYDYFQPKIHLGVTATTYRTDKRGLHNVFQSIVYSYTLEDAINDGNLVEIRQKAIETDADLDFVKIVAGDFQQSMLSTQLNTPERNHIIASGYQEHGEGRKAIVFCVDVQHAVDMAQHFNYMGINAESIYGSMDLEHRREIISAYRNNEIKVLTNCNILIEGYDDPSLSCILMARPTKSELLYTQMLGRGTRLYPGKEDLLVMDITDNSTKHDVFSLPRLNGLPLKDMDGKTIGATKLSMVMENSEYASQLDEFYKKPVKTRLKDIDPYKGSSLVNVAGYQPTEHWESEPATDRQKSYLMRNGMDEQRVEFLTKGQAQVIISQLFAITEHEPATDKQKNFLRMNFVPESVLKVISKRKASKIIDQIIKEKGGQEERMATDKQKSFLVGRCNYSREQVENMTFTTATNIISDIATRQGWAK